MRTLTAICFSFIVLVSVQARDVWAQVPNFTATYVAPGHSHNFFLDLSFRSAAMAFDSSDNLYVTDIESEKVSAFVEVFRYLKETGYTTYETPYTYSKDTMGVNGLDFDGVDNLFVSEFYFPDDGGLIREAAVPNNKIVLPSFRPTGIAVADDETIYFPGRKWSKPNFGNVYMVDSLRLPASIFMEDVVATAIAINDFGQIYFGLRDDSVWTLDPFTGVSVKIATFSGGYVEELAFDSTGALYVLEGGSDESYNPWTIIKLDLPSWIEISIKPEGNPNCINVRSKGNIPIAVLGEFLDVNKINIESIVIDDSDPSTPSVRPYKNSYKDVNKDGYTDIVLHFYTEDFANEGLILDGNVLSISFQDSSNQTYFGADVIYMSGGPNCY